VQDFISEEDLKTFEEKWRPPVFDQVNAGLKGCGKRADTMDVTHLRGYDPKLRGDSDPRENVCGSGFPTFYLGKDVIRLCQACRVKLGLTW